MNLNLPIIDKLSKCDNVLIAGMGGGYDVFCGLPIYFELERLGKSVHLASFSFSDIVGLDETDETLSDTLVGVTADIEGVFDYFPELYLAQWFDYHGEDVTIWCFEKTGARPLIKNYQILVDELGIDAIILVDGGVDSLMRGDETRTGTIFEDSLSLLAVSQLQNMKIRMTACLGLGVEHELDTAYVFDNIAYLAKQDALLGVCALTKQMPAYQRFEEAVHYVFDQQPVYPSVICSSVISATRGHYGDFHLTKRTHGSELHISPLMSQYWFFDLETVAKNNLLLSSLKLTYEVDDAWQAMTKARAQLEHRPIPPDPLR